MGTAKRERQKAARQARIEAEQAAAQKAKQRRTSLVIGGIVAIAVAIIAISVIFGGDDDSTEVEAGTDTSEAADTGDTADTGDEASEPDETDDTDTAGQADDTDTAGEAGSDECPPEDASGPRLLSFSGPPPTCIDTNATYQATLVTSEGDIVVELDPSLDPVSVNNFIFLARHNYYDDTTFHRVINGFVIQGGDPVGDPPGTGGPGYSFEGARPADPEPGEDAYQLGALAMANTGDPSSNGSQFFIVTGPQGESLPPLYSPMGQVTEGLEIAQTIQEVETDPADKPLDDVVVSDVIIEQL